ncbi:MAG: FN3 associated domain-containing protein, partial [Phycisphaerae bacterium]
AVLVADVKDLPDYFANLIVSSAAIEGSVKDLPEKEIARVQRPYGGVVCIGPLGRMRVKVRGGLEGAGEWTHNFGDAGNTMDSADTVVAGPLGMLWYQDETQVTIDRHGKNPAPLACKGVLLREGVDSVKASDAYNGALLWEVSLPGVLAAYREGTQVGGGQIGSTYCVAGDVVYVRRDDRCLLLDLFSGRKVGELKAPAFPGGQAGRWGYVACKDGRLYGTLMNEKYVIRSQHGDGGPRTQSPMEDHLTESSLLFAMDARTGEVAWTFAPKHSIRNNAIAVGDGLVYVIDRPVAEIDTILKPVAKERRRGGGALPEHPTGVLLALEAGTGKVRWRDDRDVFGTVLAVSARHDVLLMSYNMIGFARPSDWPQGMRAYRASDGNRLWASQRSARRPAIVGRRVYGFPYAWDLLTGEQQTMAVEQPGRPKGTPWRIAGKGQGCGLLAGCENLLLIRSGALGYYDLSYDTGWLENYGGIRSGCFINCLPAGGIVLAPDDTRACRCSYQNQASIALKQRGIRAPEIDPQVGQRNFRFGAHAKEPVFVGRIVVTISHELKDVEIRYTLDDSYPTAASALYTAPITLTETTPVRASAFRGGRKLAVRDVVVFTKVDDLESVDGEAPRKVTRQRRQKARSTTE